MSASSDLEALLARIVEHHVATGTLLPVHDVVGDRTELAAPLAGLVRQYLALSDALDGGHASTGSLAGAASPSETGPEPGSAPVVIDGFRTIERLGAGGVEHRRGWRSSWAKRGRWRSSPIPGSSGSSSTARPPIRP